MSIYVANFPHGIAIHGEFPSQDVLNLIEKTIKESEFGKLLLTNIDPPYGKVTDEDFDEYDKDMDLVNELVKVARIIQSWTVGGGALYVWGGIGQPGFRPFYKFMLECEQSTEWNLANHITWKKKRAYGIQHNYIFTREELAYFIKGDIKKPFIFNIPLLEEKRGYAGYNAKYPAKSEYYRRTNVWTDITEIMRGKIVETQKPERVIEIPIEIHTGKPEHYVLDVYAGSGTTAIAALNKNRKFIVVERKQETYNKLIDRITQWYNNR